MKNQLIEAIDVIENQMFYWRNECDSEDEAQRSYALSEASDSEADLNTLREALRIVNLVA
tara:strand:+ start:61 stop:240 length:180 start_codon:yes stop_codon:yes gene_type:complete